jgi:VWFA-related protein
VNTLVRGRSLVCASAAAVAIFVAAPSGQERPTGQGFSFKTGVDLVNVSVTVTDANGRFVSGLKKDDFIVYEDGKPQEVAQFDSERVPVSLGIALDTSGSMLGEKIVAAQAALNRFLLDLLGPQDEVFLYRFDGRPELVQSWTKDRRAVSQALGSVKPMGGTALYDTVSQAIPLAQGGSNKKKALVDLRRQRYEQPHARARAPADHPRIRSARLRHRHRRVGQRQLLRASIAAITATVVPHAADVRASARAVSRRAGAAVAPEAGAVSDTNTFVILIEPSFEVVELGRSSESRRAARDHRRQRRPHGDHCLAEGPRSDHGRNRG